MGIETASETEVITRLRLAVMRLARRLRQHSQEGELTPSLIAALSSIERLGPLTLSELAAAERVQPPSMTRIVSRLEDAGFIVREVDPADRRSAKVRLSPAGSRVLGRSRTKKNIYLGERLASFTPAERTLLEQALPLLERLIGDEG